MKKVFYSLSVAALALTMASCGGNKADNNDSLSLESANIEIVEVEESIPASETIDSAAASLEEAEAAAEEAKTAVGEATNAG
ncbi:MAG: hypothetical protein K2J15_05295, partial [Muribaculaceae bacterium]|nr:hypothetical protein [Muribaculaceae bacterium]